MKRTHLDLFSGIGGFALACRWAGVETVGFAEIDDYASRVLAKNFPGVTNYGDVRNVPGSAAAWLVTGGFPCQPFSVAGKQGGASDDRWLWQKMAGVVERTRPTWVLAENVPGIIGMELDTVLSDLERLGYTAWPVIVPACSVDAPHRRERVWIVAHDDKCGQQRTRTDSAEQDTGTDWRHDTGRSGKDVAHSYDTGCEQQRRAFTAQAEYITAECGSCEWEAEFWEPEPGVGRVAHGIPARVDRLKGLGNAIVPQVAYQLIQMMIAAEELG